MKKYPTGKKILQTYFYALNSRLPRYLMGVLCFTDFCLSKKIGNILTQKSDTEICSRILIQNIVTIFSRHVVLCIFVYFA